MALYNADEKKADLFRFDLLKPVIDRELRDRLPEILAGNRDDFTEAVDKVLADANAKARKLFETVKDGNVFGLKMACTIYTIADCNSVFPVDYEFAIAVLFLDDMSDGHCYATIRRSLVARINIQDGLLRVPVCQAASKEEFEAGHYKIAWLTQQDSNPRE